MVSDIFLAYGSVVTIWVACRVYILTKRYLYKPEDYERKTEGQTDVSVSVCIAARNETHALAQSLELLLASNYSKLEILVLDDRSDDNTSVIIRSFAHAGVRFIPGRTLPPGWLGRNHAYSTLAHEASGDFIMFMDVDTKFDTQAISTLVQYAQAHQLDMLSVQPSRNDSIRASTILGTLRQVWELLTASKLKPPAASGIWMLRRARMQTLMTTLKDYGLSVRPELHLAQILQRDKKYRYVIAPKTLGMSYEKRWSSQAETAIRLYLPLFGSHLRGVVRTILIFFGLLAPYIVLIQSILNQDIARSLFVFTISLSAGYMYAHIAFMTHHRSVAVFRAILWPILLLQDAMLYFLSVYRYTTGSVTWKGRNITAQPKNHEHLEVIE